MLQFLVPNPVISPPTTKKEEKKQRARGPQQSSHRGCFKEAVFTPCLLSQLPEYAQLTLRWLLLFILSVVSGFLPLHEL